MKIVVCGSMTFSKDMVKVKKELIKLGHDVTIPEFAEEYTKMGTIEKVHTESARNKIDYDLIKGYFKKIKDSDAVLIVNESKNEINGYIGGNSFLEMGFAYVLDKKLFVLNQLPIMNYSDEIEVMKPIVLNGDLTKIK